VVVDGVVDGSVRRQRDTGRPGRRRDGNSRSLELADVLVVGVDIESRYLPIDRVFGGDLLDHHIVDSGRVHAGTLDVDLLAAVDRGPTLQGFLERVL